MKLAADPGPAALPRASCDRNGSRRGLASIADLGRSPRESSSRRVAKLLLALLALACASTAAAQSDDLPTRVAELRRRGEDLAAARLLDAERAQHPSPRLSAELGLAYQGAGRPVDAEVHLRAALAAENDPWIAEHRAGLTLALRYVEGSLGWVVVRCTTPGADARVLGSLADPAPCGEPLRIGAGEQQIEVRAAGHRSVREIVRVAAGRRARVRVRLEPFECATAGMEHVGGDEGGCCWPGQSWEDGCAGSPECPDGGWVHGDACMSPDTPPPGPPRLAVFHFGILGGATNFARTDTSLFRPGVDPHGRLASLGPRVELRAGVRLFELLALDLTVGGTRQDMAGWLDCAPGTGNCVSGSPLAYTLDAGLMLTAHTNPPRIGGNVDFHLGIGARPVARIFFDDDAGGAEPTATVVPAELGMSIFFADVLSFDVLGQAELWLPWEYCGHGSGGTAYCLGPDALDYEVAWSGLAGLTLHAD